MIKNICKNCGKEYEYEYKQGTCKTQYCSTKCKLEYLKKQTESAPECTEDLLRKMYLEENKTIYDLCEYFHLTIKQTVNRLKKYGIKKDQKEVAKNRNKSMEEKYGASCAMHVPEFKDKVKQTTKERYGVECSFQSEEVKEKIRETNLDRYGVACVSQNPEVKKKIEETNLERYGSKNVFASPIIQDRIKETTKERYGTENISQSDYMKDMRPQIMEKQYATKDKNHSWCVSKPELKIKRLLEEKFENVKYQYKTEEYPYNCDFYIPKLNLYMEYQGHWTHGGHAYTGSEEDEKLLMRWESKSNESPLYRKAKYIWTISDVYKRNIAKEKRLNWVEFFNLDQFFEWYNSLS